MEHRSSPMEIWECDTVDFEDEQGPQSKECKWPLEAKKGNTSSPTAPRRNGACPIFILGLLPVEM